MRQKRLRRSVGIFKLSEERLQFIPKRNAFVTQAVATASGVLAACNGFVAAELMPNAQLGEALAAFQNGFRDRLHADQKSPEDDLQSGWITHEPPSRLDVGNGVPKLRARGWRGQEFSMFIVDFPDHTDLTAYVTHHFLG